MNSPMWQPSKGQIQAANLTAFILEVEDSWSVEIPNSTALHKFSINEREKFWLSLIKFSSIKAETWGEEVLVDGNKMPGAIWFPKARLNYAENMLTLPDGVSATSEAIVFKSEIGFERRLTFCQIQEEVSVLAQALSAEGIKAGDRVAGYLPNMPETIIAMLAANTLGAIWSSCSPDFGVQGVLDRFGQIEPKILFSVDGYYYNGNYHDIFSKTAKIIAASPSLQKTIIIPYDKEKPSKINITEHLQVVSIDYFTAPFVPKKIIFQQLSFNHPLYILFSSGTTGAPKCIVHSQGGALLKHATEHILHCDVNPNDRVFFYTTCGWMMWNWLVTNLSWGATLLLYDGSPFYPSPSTLFDYIDAEKATLFGTSAKFIDAIMQAGLAPKETHDLSYLKTFCSTGSPLSPESFDYIYEKVITEIPLVSFSGGTDIVGSFCGGDPTKPVWRGEIQTPMLGIALDVFDDNGSSVRREKGELVCTLAFPSMPVGFWKDNDDRLYKKTYFKTFPNVWTHGDYVAITEHGGIIIYGRSDATLNPGGVRIGTAEIYRQVELLDEIIEAIVIGQIWKGDVRVVLFVILKETLVLDVNLIERIKRQVRTNCTPRHVPEIVVQVNDIPRTKSGKITELAVRDIVHGREINNKEALINPESLEYFRDLPQLRT